MKRHHTSDNWTFGFLEFDKQRNCPEGLLQRYSCPFTGTWTGWHVSQIDGSKGTIVGEEIHVVSPEDLGERREKHRLSTETDGRLMWRGTEVIEKIELELPDQLITWENPLRNYPLTEGQIPVADELLSLANAILHDTEPKYGAQLGTTRSGDEHRH